MHHARILPTTWVIRHDPPATGASNMARDLTLLETVAPGIATWRWYTWDQPTVSFGRNERTIGWYTPESVSNAGLAVVRRPTGGRALLHARELTYSVTLPLPAKAGWRVAYNAINAVLLTLLRGAGVPATLSDGVAVAPDGLLCFEQPAPGEIAVLGRKLVGSAVWRQGDGYLQHGSLLIHDDQARLLEARIDKVRNHGPSSGQGAPALPPAATLAAIFPTLDTPSITARITDALPTTLHAMGVAETIRDETPDTFPSDSRDISAWARHLDTMADPTWIWRR